MDRRITIEEPTSTLAADGQPVDSWSTYREVWAEIKYGRGSEYFTAAQELAEQTATFRIWYDSGITKKMRISYNSLYWDILSIAELGYREGLEIIAQAQGD